MKKKLTFILALACILTLSAQTPRLDIKNNPRLSGSNYLAYPTPEGKLTPAPKGYKPFFIDHYGRHGSRWHIGESSYNRPLEILRKADKAGKLTTLGKDALRRLEIVAKASTKRLGELTPLGAEQHQQIAARMFRNFPEVFAGNSKVDARSTIVIRCILSMTNEIQTLKVLNPQLRVTTDASEADMDVNNPMHAGSKMTPATEAWDDAMRTFRNNHTKPERFIATIFNDADYVAKNINKKDFYSQMFKVACNQQSIEQNKEFDFYDLFTNDELYDMWLISNVDWYTNYANCPGTANKRPFTQARLLQDFLDKADAAIASGENSAWLRFGHEVCVMPLASLMELGNAGIEINNVNDIESQWQNYKIFPMASNIQWIFFRKKGSDDILVKALLNEKEMTLPVKSDVAPYYHWSDLEAYYKAKLAKWDQKTLEFK